MILQLAAASLLALSGSAVRTDTVVLVPHGARLELNDFGGSIAITTWDRSAVRVTADHAPRTRLIVDTNPGGLVVRAVRELRVPLPPDPRLVRVEQVELPTSVAYQITVPRWMDLRLSGVNTAMDLKGVEGEVNAQTVRGSLNLVGGRRFIRLCTIDGGVNLERARGRIEVSSINQGVVLAGVEGPIRATSVNGDIRLERVVSEDVEASTVSGGILYDGNLRDEGRYRFASHDGDLVIYVPDHTSAAVSVSTYEGDFHSSFPIQVQGVRHARRFDFVLGRGDAELDLESFAGAIRLLRARERRLERSLEHK
jgi:DUF4097 and DUF4098 domain-containing protein YvlB